MPWPPVPPASWWEWLYSAIELGAVALCAARALGRPGERLAWLVIALGMLSFAVGDVYYTIVFENAKSVPFPSIDDAFYLACYPAWYLGIGLLLRARAPRMSAAMWLDGIIGGLAVAAVGSALIFGVVVADTGGAPLTVATNLAYLLGDLLLLGIVVGVLTLTGWTLRGGWVLIGIGLAVFAVVDSIYLYQAALGTYTADKLLDVGWPATMVLIAAAACLLGVVVCLALSFGENMRMLRASRQEALTDALTGLANRRGLMAEIEELLAGWAERPFTLAMYDLDGFKGYNDGFGHAAGDALLARLGARLGAALAAGASAFRMGGDEFCVLVPGVDEHAERTVVAARDSLTETGEGFSIGCSYGAVRVPEEARDAERALVIADQRMYEQKGEGRMSAGTAPAIRTVPPGRTYRSPRASSPPATPSMP